MENTRSIEEIRAERVKVGKAQAAALRKAYRCDARLSELSEELGEAAGGDTEAVGRTAGEITEELGKVSRARNNATRKLIRCRDRLLELDEEERRCAG